MPVSREQAPYLGARDLRFNYGSILNEISSAVKIPDCSALKWKGSNARDLCVICQKDMYQTDLRCQSL